MSPDEVLRERAAMAAWMSRQKQRARRRLRLLGRQGTFLSADSFCRRRGISREHLVRLERRGDIFSVIIDHKRRYPAVLCDRRYSWTKLARFCRRLGPHVPPMLKDDALVSRFGSLGGITVLQALRRGDTYRLALELAEGTADEHAAGTAVT
jgi:hypothetical protein